MQNQKYDDLNKLWNLEVFISNFLFLPFIEIHMFFKKNLIIFQKYIYLATEQKNIQIPIYIICKISTQKFSSK